MLSVGAVITATPAVVALYYRDGCAVWFILCALILVVVGIAMLFVGRNAKTSITGKEGMALAALTWILLSVVGALPSVFSGAVPSFTDAFFDTVSGYTTTGATVLSSMEDLPRSILFWRAFTHWVGGLGILAFAVAVLPKGKNKGDGSASEAHAIRAEAPGPTFGKLVSKLRFNTQILYAIYLGLTLIEMVLLLFGDMPIFDSVCNSMATMGSGGFSVINAGIGGYNSAYIEWIIGVFMVLAGLNFNFYYFMIVGKVLKALKMDEVRWYLFVILASTAIISTNIYHIYLNLGDSIRHAFFQVASIISTTGFATANFDLWPETSKVILVLLMFIGGCAGSTGGGIKVSRIVVMLKTGIKEIRYYINPREIRAVHFDGEPIERSVMTGISSYFIVYMFLFATSVLLISLDGHDFTTSFTSVAACINNVGPGLSKVGPASNFSCMSAFSKYVLSFDMLLGRLELFPMLVLLSPRAWRR